MSYLKKAAFTFCILILSACATYKAQYANEQNIDSVNMSEDVAHTFYLIGDAGNATSKKSKRALERLEKDIQKADKNSTLLFLGDNIYPKGLPKKKSDNYSSAKMRLENQIAVAKNFKGRTIFIPGNRDWKSGIDALKEQEKLIEDALGKNSFLPESGCPLEKVEISDDIQIIVVDTEWYLTDWDKHPKMNDKCVIKTREKFLEELEGLVKKARGKTTIIALHQPMFTQGPYGGQYSFTSHLTPLPILGTLKNIIRETAGLNTTDIQNKRFMEMRDRIATIAQYNEKSIFVSGHENSLQYMIDENVPQIVSGSGSKATPTKLTRDGFFSYGKQGYAKLTVFKDGSSVVSFYAVGIAEPVFMAEVLEEDIKLNAEKYSDNFASQMTASVYTQEEITKGNSYKFFWGDRYRKYYGTQITVPTVKIDTLFGGLKPVRRGGGHQSKSLRLEDAQGREFMMRAIRKKPIQYLQSVAFKGEYIMGGFNYDYTEDLLLDIFTGAHPYAPFAVATLSDAVGVFHTNPVLYYIPKQPAIGDYNDKHGGELYMIEERAADGHGNNKSFGYANEIISTDDLLDELPKDEDHILDERSYIRARLFDMLIGDWDRHEDQWRWALFKENGKDVYRPVPRDRDQAFSIMADGALLTVATRLIPSLRLMQSYDEEIRSPKWFNLEPYALDMALINQSTKADWDAEVQHIVTNLTDDVIEKAFANLPKEVQDETIGEIKRKLRGRRKNLQKISDAYFKEIHKFQVVKGTHKDDWFDILRMPDGKTKVSVYRIKGGEKKDLFHEKIYDRKETQEIWIYGLDDDDVFVVDGKPKKPIKIRIIGGQNKDTYDIKEGRQVIVYDYESKKSEFKTSKGRKTLSDNYDTNVYNYKKLKYNSNQFLPALGFNPDDGINLGFSHTYTVNGFNQNPFTEQHTFGGGYFFATNGYRFNYTGEFARVIGSVNFGVEAAITSPNFARNFFGFGNQTMNLEPDNDAIDMDYNRVKIAQLRLGSFLSWRGDLNSHVKLGVTYETYKVENTPGRFLESVFPANSSLFDTQKFLGGEFSYSYQNRDRESYPTMGMSTDLQIGYKSNLDDSKGFAYAKPTLAFDHKILPSGLIVFATQFSGQVNFGDNFEFYQAATLGADTGLRGYRRQRFIGNSSFVQTSDIRMLVGKIKTNLFPLYVGIYGGFDYGKVWADNLPTGDWNTSAGGGIFFNAASKITGNLSVFKGDEDIRFAFQLGFGF